MIYDMKVIIDIEGHMCICTDTCITIVDSNKVPDNDIPRFISMLSKKISQTPKLKDVYKRSEESWIKEWRAHNRLYRMSMFVKHTKDVDFEENENIIRLLAYQILGREKK